MISLGEKLRTLRKSKGYTQNKIAGLLGLSLKAVSRYENNRAEPDIDTIIRLALIFNVDVNYLTEFVSSSLDQAEYTLMTGDIDLLQLYHRISKGHQKVVRLMIQEFERMDQREECLANFYIAEDKNKYNSIIPSKKSNKKGETKAKEKNTKKPKTK